MARPTPVIGWDPYIQATVVRIDGPWIISVSRMIYNDRVVLTHESEYPYTARAGYCYDQGGVALHAATLWNPLKELRPKGYKKIAYESKRTIEGEQKE